MQCWDSDLFVTNRRKSLCDNGFCKHSRFALCHDLGCGQSEVSRSFSANSRARFGLQLLSPRFGAKPQKASQSVPRVTEPSPTYFMVPTPPICNTCSVFWFRSRLPFCGRTSDALDVPA